jgi:hypothetical protein
MDSKDEMIAALRALAARIDARELTLRRFFAETGLNKYQLARNFGTWRALCAAAQIKASRLNGLIPDETLLTAMRNAFVAAGGVVGPDAFEDHFAHSTRVLRTRFGSWARVLARFESWARANAPEFPYFDALARARTAAELRAKRREVAPAQLLDPTAARPCGAPVRLGALLHAPINENGVILAFGMFADRLGFAIESVAAGFPDCIAKRRLGEERWQTVRIEFEYRSRSFRDHGHDPAGCDRIVSWAHDWADCPLPVIELRSALAELDPGRPV